MWWVRAWEEKRHRSHGMNNKERIDEAFEKALNDFDFEKVRKVMKYLNWTWGINGITPNYPEMIRSVRALYRHAKADALFNKTTTTVGGGGFEVKVYPGEGGGVEIKFVLSYSDYFFGEDE